MLSFLLFFALLLLFWNEKGLCRVGIADEKFVVLFPKLEMPDLSKTKSIRVGYYVGRAEKHLAIDDPKQVSNLISTVTIKARNQYYPEPNEEEYVGGEHSGTRVDFILPNGEARKMAIVTDRVLHDARGGQITLDTTAFFDTISELVSKAEGRAVDLLTKSSAK